MKDLTQRKKMVCLSLVVVILVAGGANAVRAGMLPFHVSLTHLHSDGGDDATRSPLLGGTVSMQSESEPSCPLVTDKLSITTTSSSCEDEKAAMGWLEDSGMLVLSSYGSMIAGTSAGALLLGDINDETSQNGILLVSTPDGIGYPRAFVGALGSGGGGEQDGRFAGMVVADGEGQNEGAMRASITAITQPTGAPEAQMQVFAEDESEAASVAVQENNGTAEVKLNNVTAGSSMTLQSDGDIVIVFGN